MEQSETVSRPIDAAILHEIGQAKIDLAPLPTRAERLDEWESWGYDRRELSRLFPDTHVFRIVTQVILDAETGDVVTGREDTPPMNVVVGERVTTYTPLHSASGDLYDVQEHLSGNLIRRHNLIVSPETLWRLSCIEAGWTDEEIRKFEDAHP
jgi:hypothetical protein